MNRRIKKALILSLLGVVTIFCATWPSALTFIIQQRLRSVRAQGYPITWSGLKAGWYSVAFDGVSATLPGPAVSTGSALIPQISIPIPLEARSTSIRIVPSSLLLFSPTLRFESTLYGGKIAGEAGNLRSGPTLRATLDSLRVDEHPLLLAAGLRGGVLSAHTDALILPPGNKLPQGSVSIEVKQISSPDIPELRTLLKGDSLGPIDLRGKITSSEDSARFEGIEIKSPLASITGNATISGITSRAPDAKGSFRVTLTDRGFPTVGPWLPLISGGAVQSDMRAFSAQLSSRSCAGIPPGHPRVPLGARCLTLTYTP